MQEKKYFIYLISCLALFVPVPAHLGYGIIILFLHTILLFALFPIIKYLSNNEHAQFYLYLIFISLTILFYLLFSVYSPVIMFTLGFTLFLVPISPILMYHIEIKNSTQNFNYQSLLKTIAFLNICTLIFFSARELLAWRSLSLPLPKGIYFLFPAYKMPILFWASIPGALCILAFFLALLSFINRLREKNL